MFKRSAGILMPISSLPSEYGIGTLGKAAYDFVDFLDKADQTYWQILPLGPTGYGDSPYASVSTFAGNPYLIDLGMLIEDGILSKADLKGLEWGDDPEHVDYGAMYNNRFKALKSAFVKGSVKYAAEIKKFREENSRWVNDYALYMALKKHFDMKCWIDWTDDDIRMRRNGAVEKYTQLLKDEIDLWVFIQYLFFTQWDKLKKYANSKNIKIIGDIPIYVSMDSSDVWSEARFFMLDRDMRPTLVSGVPPDYFSADGQLWGNPLYNWDEMKKDGYGWWIRRIDGAKRICDVIRIDHFRGFESYWAVKYGEKTARNGKWIKGPGMDLLSILKGWFSSIDFIAEDLGILTDDVRKLLKDSGFPGMKILEFAFSEGEPSDYLTYKYEPNCVCYVGTHDNDTVMGWKETAPKYDIKFATEYFGLSEEEGFNFGMIRGGMSSVANIFIAQMQDYLGLGSEGRMNAPGMEMGNWQWRMKKGAANAKLAAKIAHMTKVCGRNR